METDGTASLVRGELAFVWLLKHWKGTKHLLLSPRGVPAFLILAVLAAGTLQA